MSQDPFIVADRPSLRFVIRALAVVAGVLPAGCTDWFSMPEYTGPELQVFEDHYRFRNQDYTSERTLHVAIVASGETPASVRVRECLTRERAVAVIELVRRYGREDVKFEFPPDC